MVDRYQIDEMNPIGVGSYGYVYTCTISSQFYELLKSKRIALPINSQNKMFALKFQTYDTLFFEQISILREIDVLMRTKNYPGTVEIFDFYLNESTKQAFLILKLAKTSLDHHIDAETNPFKRLEEVPFIATQMLLHLSYLKHNSIAHRDIKPQNILVKPAPNIFGWSVHTDHIANIPPNASSTTHKIKRVNSNGSMFGGTYYSIESLTLDDKSNPMMQMCKFFLPMAHNCSCFTDHGEPDENSAVKPKIIYRDIANLESTRNSVCDANTNKKLRRGSKNNNADESREITIKSLKRAESVGSAPSKKFLNNRNDRNDRTDNEDDDNNMQTECQSPPAIVTPLCEQLPADIFHRGISIPLVQICDFGLSKHINKTHHSPFIVTPNFRSPELFDPTSFVDPNPPVDGQDNEGTRRKPNSIPGRFQMRSSLQMSAESISSSDPNDVSLKRDEDLAYNENIDVWGLGCTLAEMVTGKTLFQGEDLSTVYNALKALFTESSDSRRNSMTDSFGTADYDTGGDGNNMMFDVDDTAPTQISLKPDPRFLRASISGGSTNAPVTWITTVERRSQILRHKIYLQLIAKEPPTLCETVAHRVCDRLGEDFFDLLATMLDPNPYTRPDAEQLLQHKFIRPFVESSMLLIYSVALNKFRQVPKQQLIPLDTEYHWWAFQNGLRVGGFEKNQFTAFAPQHHEVIRTYRLVIFSWMLQVIRDTNCRYQTLFAAMYNFDRCIANFPRNTATKTLLNFDNYKLFAICCLYLVVRYYERIYITIGSLMRGLHIEASASQIEKVMSLFIDCICGQITLPSPWHFVLTAFKQMCCSKQSEFAAIEHYQKTMKSLFFNGFALTQKKKLKRLQKTVEQQQLLAQLQNIRDANDETLVQQLRSDARSAASIYTSNFKKHCSRLLFFVMQSHSLFYISNNNRSLGSAVFKRCLFNALFCGAFARLKLRKTSLISQKGLNMRITLVRAR